MNTTENNKKLAEFLGIKSDDSGWYIGTDLYSVGLPFNYGAMGNGTRDLKFHNDWNWLMLVAEKIEQTETKDNRTFTIDMHKDNVIINQYGKYNNEIIVTGGGTRIENLYKACIKFVEWYNKEEEPKFKSGDYIYIIDTGNIYEIEDCEVKEDNLYWNVVGGCRDSWYYSYCTYLYNIRHATPEEIEKHIIEDNINYLIENGIATEDEIILVCNIVGHTQEALESILYARTAL